MKTFKKILIALCVLAVVASAVVVGVLATGGTVDEAMAKVQAYNEAADTAAKRTAYADLVEYVGTVDTGADGYDGLTTAMLAVHTDYAATVLAPDIQNKQKTVGTDHRYSELVEAYQALATLKEQYPDAMTTELEQVLTDAVAALNGYATDLITAYSSCTTFLQKAHAYSVVQALVTAWPIPEEDTDTAEAYAALLLTYEQDLAEALETYYSKATFEMYTSSAYTYYQFHYTFDDMSASPSDFNLTKRGEGNGAWIERDTNVLGNRYYTIHWETKEPDSSGSAHTYMEPELDLTSGGVIEFDMTTFGVFPDMTIQTAEGPTGDRAFTNLISFSQQSDGTIDLTTKGWTKAGAVPAATTVEDVIVPGQWTHFTLVYHADTAMMDLYVNYEFVATFEAYNKHGQSHFRIGAETGGRELSMDNFFVYAGTAPRVVDRLTNMTDSQKLLYYASVIGSESESPADRNSAYTLAGALLPIFWSTDNSEYLGSAIDNAELQAAVDVVVQFDYDELLSKLKVANLAELATRIADYKTLPRTLDELKTRGTAITALETFINDNVFDTNSADFAARKAEVAALRATYDNDVACDSFITAMDRFAISPSLSGMKRYYTNAQTNYLILDVNTQFDDADENQQLADALAAYANAEEAIAAVERRNNAKQFRAVLNNIRVALAEDDWQQNTMLRSYVKNARQTLREGNYDTSYEGLDELMSYYEEANAYFWPLLQSEHADYIDGRLTDFAAASAYIERLGILRSIGYYINTESNEVDRTNTEIAQLIANYETCLEELEIQEDRYKDLLQENTEKFVNLMHIIAATDGYENLKPLYDRAAALYFSMNISAVTDAEGNEKFTLDEVKACISAFDAVTAALDRIELASDLFIANAAQLTGEGAAALSETEKYRILVECYRYVDEVDTSYTGVATAMEAYGTALAAYNATVAPLSGEITSTVELSVSARALCGMRALMAAIRELMP